MKTYSIRDLVTIYSVTKQTALKWIHSGDLKAINCGTELGKKKPRWRGTEKALADFENLRAAQTSPPTTRRRKRKPSTDVVEFF